MFRDIFHQSGLPQVIIEPDLTYLEMNHAFCEFLGYTKEEYETLTIESVSHPDDFLLDYRQFQRLVKGSITEYEMVKRYIHKNGSIKTGRLKVSRIRDRATQRVLYLGQVYDLTEFTKIYEGLRQSEQKYRLLAENSSDIICLHDSFGHFLYISPSIKAELGYDPEELIGCYSPHLIHPEDQDVVTFKEQTITFRAKRKNGSYIWMETTIKRVINDETCACSQFITVSRNIQKRKETDELLTKSEKLAIVGQMAAAVAHEIRNPLTPIKGFIQLLNSGMEVSSQYSSIVLNEINRIESILSEFLTLAKPTERKMEAICVDELLEQVIQIFSPQAFLANKEIIFQKSGRSNRKIKGDSNSLKQVFYNVFQNALDAIEEKGRIMVTLEEGGEVLCVRVIDNGCGIPEERIKLIGEPFYSTKEKGTGLGLMTSYNIIENHDGTISFESKEGKGTTVTISFPYVEKEA
ncbi:PAS domain S-box protein [Robertmurraya korlensis]|uniref:PAS domain S-box protein n=1 Tax=Robertmurraya korlensis TaxID=519977 RepID=UPI0008243C96|nr:PAS domain S-box protein [Robertmurraya korlensis]